MRHRVASDFECFDCGARFSHERSLHQHIDESHRCQRLYTCDICEKGYSRRDNLRAHMVNHERRPKVRSEVHMSDKGRRECEGCRTTREHEKTTTRICKIQVDVCEKGYSRRDNLRAHMVNHERRPKVRSEVHMSDKGRRECEGCRTTREHEEKTTTRICSEVQEPTIAEAEIQVDVSPGTMEAVDSWKMGPGLSGKPLSLLRQQVKDEQSEDSENEQEEGMDLPEKVKLGKPIVGPSYTKINHVHEGDVGPAMSVEDLERGLVGNLKTITEKTTRRVFRNGELVSEDEVTKEFTVDMMVGTTKAETD
ncbi:protein bowel-like [Lytechinus variegatus]|uniref:protein bowel-like n=1 Tax=Lytechinus variegatus TaxID=7654 RepID=UPI001BB227D6|nr:protein bowel-like [Lytechinus variegatus]